MQSSDFLFASMDSCRGSEVGGRGDPELPDSPVDETVLESAASGSETQQTEEAV